MSFTPRLQCVENGVSKIILMANEGENGTMIVSKLIEELLKIPPDYEVKVIQLTKYEMSAYSYEPILKLQISQGKKEVVLLGDD